MLYTLFGLRHATYSSFTKCVARRDEHVILQAGTCVGTVPASCANLSVSRLSKDKADDDGAAADMDAMCGGA